MFRTLGDRVPQWATLNEPWVVFDNGYVSGIHAPAACDWAEAGAGFAESVAGTRRGGCRVSRRIKATNRARRQSGARRSGDRFDPPIAQAATRMDAYLNRHFLDPVFLGKYPSEMREMFGPAWPAIDDADAAQIQTPIDFVGINYYLRLFVADDPGRRPAAERASSTRPTVGVPRPGGKSIRPDLLEHSVGSAIATAIYRSTSPKMARLSTIIPTKTATLRTSIV